jgi:arylsulfatase A-like enzyme
VFGSSYQGKIDGSIDTIQAIEHGKLTVNATDRARLGELYQGEIAYVDAQIGRLLDDLERRGLADQTVVALTGDHGESFGEHGDWTHGLEVFETEIRVPLLLRYSSRVPAGITVTQPVQLVDVMPTLLELAGLKSSSSLHGASLLTTCSTTRAKRTIWSAPNN